MNAIPAAHLEALQSFAIFADTLNLSESARRLHISQPALHAKFRKLGEQLRVPLYVRQGRQLHLTAEGLEVARHARELLALNQRLVQRMSGAPAQDSVSLVAGEGAYLHLLGKALSRFRSPSKPAVLRLLAGDRERAVAAVEQGEAELGVAPLGEAAGRFDSQALTSVGQVLIVPKSHPLAQRRFASLKDLKDQSLIVPPVGRPHRELLGQLLAAKGIGWQVAVEANGWALMQQFAAWGVGLAVVNAFCPAPRGTVAVPLKGYPPLVYHVFQRSGHRLGPAASRLRDGILTHAEQWRTDLALPQWS
ncbi:LysR family transcriptional regulator [Paracidovorax konjaci]|uniref:DNA-binding transcriptional regulator, LysR family n=1 Tax=Paracidovorax konjaci TaxID=32040 RepID=A0A1I1VAS6_9BURK|nr:LysR family transcriptional regulator [Paracidovorax konjaci]SFD80077.1 DNA-binding transcriptional regulator, LysR family [Paracidovorax konjaci]